MGNRLTDETPALIVELRRLNDDLMKFHDAYADRMGIEAADALRCIVRQPMSNCEFCGRSEYHLDDSGACGLCMPLLR